MARKAVIDIGSNSVKFFVGELSENGTLITVLDTGEVTRLGEGLHQTGKLSAAAMERSAAAVASYAALAAELGAEETVAVGTMALRTAANSGAFIRQVADACGVQVRIIPGEEEARLSYLAVCSALPLKEEEVVVFDTGGGSTEFVFGKGREVHRRFSVNVGSVIYTEKYFSHTPVEETALHAARLQLAAEFAKAGVRGAPAQLVGIGGTVTTMAAVKYGMVHYDPAVIQGSILTKEDILSQMNRYRACTLEERRKIPGLQPKRADIILAGACILDAITDCLHAESLVISDRGLRHGLVYEMLGR